MRLRPQAARRACFLLASMACFATAAEPELDFDPDRAYGHLRAYMDLSPLPPGSASSAAFADYVRGQLEPLGFEVSFDEWVTPDAPGPLRNVLGRKGREGPIYLLGAHYDTRLRADRDPDPSRRLDPVPGANDGGSGVAVLLELARAIQLPTGIELRLAFFDAEDQGGMPGYSGNRGGWILGSQRMASRLDGTERSRVAAVIVVDIVGDPQLKLVREGLSDPELAGRIWSFGRQLGYGDTFVDGVGGAVTDDHVPFRELGLRVLDIIQLEASDGSQFFRWHHTTLDTIDRVGRDSLGKVGRTLEAFFESATLPAPAPLFLRWGPSGLAPVAAILVLGLALLLVHRYFRRRSHKRRSAPRPRGRR